MANTGLTTANAASNVSPGTRAWVNPGNALAADTAVATSTATGKNVQTSQVLMLTNFGFNIPAGATIDGVFAQIRRRSQVSASAITDNTIQLVVGGSRSGSNKAIAGAWPLTFNDVGYGGAADLWGLSLTPAIVNASNFGFSIQATVNQSTVATNGVAQVDVAWLDIYYTEPPSTAIKMHSYRQRRI